MSQSAVVCLKCGNSAVYYCQNCDDPFCAQCKQEHEEEKPQHNYVSYFQKSQRVCKEHIGNIYIYWCEACREACCTMCLVTSHNGHHMEDINQWIYTRKNKLRDSISFFRTGLARWRVLLAEAKQMTDESRIHIQNLDQALVTHSRRIHDAVQMNLEKMHDKLQQLRKSEQMHELQEKEIYTKCEEFQKHLNNLEYLEDSNDINALKCNLNYADIADLPTLTQYSRPSYSPGQINDQEIKTMIGTLKDRSNAKADIDHCKEEPSPRSAENDTAFTCKNQPVVLSSFNPDYADPYIACSKSSDLAWIETGGNKVDLVDRRGTVHDIINTNFSLGLGQFFAVTPKGHVVFPVYDGRKIVLATKQTTKWKFETLFSTAYWPGAICWLRNDDVIVTYPFRDIHRVIHHNQRGNVVHEFDPRLFSVPQRVAVNKVNDDIYACDKALHKMLAFGKDHQFRFEYTGIDATLFNPMDVSTDNTGRVLLTDGNRIYILDPDGRFLQYLQPSGLRKPLHIDIDSAGYAWIGEKEKEVKVVKYQ